ncbi:Uncharacterised protein [Mycobacterium tuberculosis]|nr:Uncharacterised protein [Mycobacterium tuberculosis]
MPGNCVCSCPTGYPSSNARAITRMCRSTDRCTCAGDASVRRKLFVVALR